MVAGYLAAVIGMALAFARRQHTGHDYFLAGRAMSGWTLAFSILANQASAVSLVGAPAFVALRPGGGLRWLQYELALPLAMLLAIVVLLPALRAAPGPSIYAVAEQRFGLGTRRALAATFLLARGLALGVILYASALVVAHALGWPVDAAIVAIGLFSLAYTSVGGIVADIWSDVVQLALLWGGTLAAAVFIIGHAGPGVLDAIPADRTATLILGTGFRGDSFALWPMLLGGVFLYLSYYACDQTQAQRLLTARDDAGARRALLLNGLLRFPLVLSYCGFGLLLAGLLRTDAGFAAAMQGQPADRLVPVFMMEFLPSGLRGLFLAGILAAAMSSIDSTLNSLAAVTLDDVLRLDPTTRPARLGRLTSLGWGIFAVASGMVFARSGSGVLELVNQVGSAFYGPVLAVFVLGVVAPAVGGRAAVAGLVAGLTANLAMGALAPWVSWLWWNVTGFLAATAVALAAGGAPAAAVWPAWLRREALLLLGAFAAMLAVLLVLPLIFGRAG
ncbi:MAG: sodium transporter [Gemmatimonadetes bacterium]|nr:sodium transporter [Gemmatimonadota bacterium]